MQVFELTPNDGHKGFYGRATVIEANGLRLLRSYSTIVAYIDAAGTFHRTWNGWSATTGRHITAFGGPNKAGWYKLPVDPVPAY